MVYEGRAEKMAIKKRVSSISLTMEAAIKQGWPDTQDPHFKSTGPKETQDKWPTVLPNSTPKLTLPPGSLSARGCPQLSHSTPP